VKIKNQVLNENQEALLNRMMVEYKEKEKNLMIEKQESDIRSKTRQLQLLILLLVITVLFTGGLIVQNIKLRNFRESLYRKEKYLDKQMAGNVQLITNMAPETDIFTKHSPEVFSDTSPGDLADVDPGLLDALFLRIISVLEKEKLYLSTVSFFRAFKHHTGLTPKEYATETRKELRKGNKEMAEMNGVGEDE
jgi:hypothetical protein